MEQEYRSIRGEIELREFAAILAHAFADKFEDSLAFITEAGDDEVRGLWRDHRLVAGFLRYPMGQWFGGRSVPMVGIAGVGTAPDARGSGVATAMMEHGVREMHEEGTALSTLYAASFPLYRRAGYETAGSIHQLKLRLTPLRPKRDLPVRAMTEEDHGAVKALKTAVTRNRNGSLDRGRVLWGRTFQPILQPKCAGFVVEDGDGLAGYVLFSLRRGKPEAEVVITDLVARTRAAGERLLALLADHGNQFHVARWNGDINDPFLMLTELGHYETKADPWMLRIVHLGNALEQRGYPVGVRAALDLEIEDPLLPANSGRYRLEVEGGRGTVTSGGEGTLRCSIRGLAPLYSGFLEPHALRSAGWIEADDEVCATAASVFTGGAPFMNEAF